MQLWCGEAHVVWGEFIPTAELADGATLEGALGTIVSGTEGGDAVIEYATSAVKVRIRQHIRVSEEAIVVRSELLNESDQALRVRLLAPAVASYASVAEGGESISWLRTGYCSANTHSPVSRSGVVRIDQPGDKLDGWWMTAGWRHDTRAILVAGFSSSFRMVGRFCAEWGGRWAAFNHAGMQTVQPGRSLASEELWLGASRDRSATLAAFARAVATTMRANEVAPPLAGWSTWGHYLEAIDADTIQRNHDKIGQVPEWKNGFSVVSIDEGWAQKLGSRRPNTTWQAAPTFAGSPAQLAAAMRSQGRRAGLWLAPLVVNDGAAIHRDHPDWLVRGDDGRPLRHALGRGVYVLDPTHPDAAQFLRELIHRITFEWGFTCLKLDFLRGTVSIEPDHPAHGLDVVRRFHGGGTGVEAYRCLLELVRSAARPGTRILACGDPLGPTMGMAQARRIGHDISANWGDDWSGILSSARNVAAHAFWSKAAIRIDPDFLLVDGEANESRVWATVIALSGGDVVVSADLTRLSVWQHSIVRSVLPPWGQVGEPVDLLENDPPLVWRLPIRTPSSGEWELVGLFNWLSQPRMISVVWLDLGLPEDAVCDVFEYWTQSDHGVHQGRFGLKIPGRSVALLAVRVESAVPALLGTDRHCTQGALEFSRCGWNESTMSLELEISPIGGEANVTLRVPAGFEPQIKEGWHPAQRKLCCRFDLSRAERRHLPFIRT